MKTQYHKERILKLAEQARTAKWPEVAELLDQTLEHIAQLEAKLATSTLRDEFAKSAMQAYASDPAVHAKGFTVADVARWSYEQADAMLDARCPTN